jgi:hypothetical protein
MSTENQADSTFQESLRAASPYGAVFMEFETPFVMKDVNSREEVEFANKNIDAINRALAPLVGSANLNGIMLHSLECRFINCDMVDEETGEVYRKTCVVVRAEGKQTVKVDV